MPLEVIGAGWGRTGTFSLKAAFETLGYPCHHMHEVFQHMEHAPVFTAAARGEAVDWESVYGPYRAAVDWPTSAFWRELMDVYPDAPVLLSVRDPQQWYESYCATIYGPVANGIPGMDDWNDMVQAAIVERDLGDPHDRDQLVAAFERHIDEVRATVPAGRLTLWQASDGWGPLCEMLGAPVPDEAFPRLNDRESFGRPKP